MTNFRCDFSNNAGMTNCLRLIIVFSWIGTLIIANQTELLIEVFIGYVVLLFAAYIVLKEKTPSPKTHSSVVLQKEKHLKQASHEDYLSVFFP